MNTDSFNGIPVSPFSLMQCLKYADETETVVSKTGALEEIPALIREIFEFDVVYLVSDENTFKAAGQKVKEILIDAGIKIAGSHIFPGSQQLKSDYKHVDCLRNHFKLYEKFPDIIPVVIGAGTLNDLVKRAAYELEIPYLCIPTAASVDGYTPNGASLLKYGFKQTFPCSAPKAISADWDILKAAPIWLSSSGFGDLAGKITAGTDWIIAAKAGTHGALQAPSIDPLCWAMVQNGLLETLIKSAEAANGDIEAVGKLFESLAITGFAMQYMKSSRPVSGTEHLFSHIWEMEDFSATHGHKVAVGTLITTAFTEIFFADPFGPPLTSKSYKRPSIDERKEEVFSGFKNSPARDRITETAAEKFMDEKTIKNINEAFKDSWEKIRSSVLEKLLPYEKLKELLKKGGCPVIPEEIGLTRDLVIADTRRAQMIRNKYGILDLSWDMGNMEIILGKIEESEKYLR